MSIPLKATVKTRRLVILNPVILTFFFIWKKNIVKSTELQSQRRVQLEAQASKQELILLVKLQKAGSFEGICPLKLARRPAPRPSWELFGQLGGTSSRKP